jgi:hypothetical protein
VLSVFWKKSQMVRRDFSRAVPETFAMVDGPNGRRARGLVAVDVVIAARDVAIIGASRRNRRYVDPVEEFPAARTRSKNSEPFAVRTP